MKALLTLLVTFVISISLIGCDDGKAENMGEEIDRKVEDASDAIDDAVDDTADAIEEACEDATGKDCDK